MKAGALILLLVLALAGGAGGGTPTGPNGPRRPGGGGGGGGGDDNGGDPGTGPAFGDFDVPPGWDPNGNGIWVDPDCRGVLEGPNFCPPDGPSIAYPAVEEPTLAEVLAAPGHGGFKGGSVYGYIDYLMNFEGFKISADIAGRILQEANALCADIPFENWSPGLRAWFDSFVERIQPWVDSNNSGIPFGGGDVEPGEPEIA